GRGGAGPGTAGRGEPPARRGDQGGGDRRGRQARLAPPVRGQDRERSHHRRRHGVRRQREEELSMERNPGAVSSAPKPLLSVADGVILMCGMVIGAGIFKAPSIVAGNTSSATAFV